MPLTDAEKAYIVDQVVEVLRAPDRKERLAALRERVLHRDAGEPSSLDEAVYSVLQAIDEIYG